MMTNSMHRKLRYQLILSRNNDDQRGMQPDCARGTICHTQPKAAVSDPTIRTLQFDCLGAF